MLVFSLSLQTLHSVCPLVSAEVCTISSSSQIYDLLHGSVEEARLAGQLPFPWN
jgi:hypothetical protein